MTHIDNNMLKLEDLQNNRNILYKSRDDIDIKKIVFNYDSVIFLAPNDIGEFLLMCNSCDIDAVAIDYDPKFANRLGYINKDFVFDDVDLNAELIICLNVEKHYPLDLPRGVDVILIGDHDEHNGDCTPIFNPEQLIDLYNVGEVYQKGSDHNGTHFYVYGKINEDRIL